MHNAVSVMVVCTYTCTTERVKPDFCCCLSVHYCLDLALLVYKPQMNCANDLLF